jgi:putative addiction module killer protein
MLRRLDRLMLGHYGDHKHISRGIYELRLHQSPGYRIYYGELGDAIVVLLVGGTKRRQQRDIEKADQYWSDFKERYDE